MAGASIDLRVAGCRAPLPLGASKRLVTGGYPALASSGTPGATSNDFALELSGLRPNALGVLYSSAEPATRPFAGATLYLADPFVRVATFHADAAGRATIPFAVTPPMPGAKLQFQAVFRDLGAPSNLGVTNGLHVEFCE
jgi:hypothetical protein